MEYYWPALFVVAMLVGSLNSKGLSLNIAFCIGLMCLYPSVESANFLTLFYLPAVLLSNFRD